MRDWADAIRDWWLRQKQRMRRLRRACLPASVGLVVLAALGVAAVMLLPLPAPLRVGIAGAVALLPLLLVFLCLIRIPDIWNLPSGWVAAGALLVSLPLVLFGQYFATRTLNEIFGEAPAFFPVASMAAGYLGVVLGALGLVSLVALAVLMMLASWMPLAGVIGRIGGRRALFGMAVYLLMAGLTGRALGSVDHLERRARDWVTRIAIEADFHAHHRCDASGWPEGIARVAFIGDEQVLGYALPAGSIAVLSCRRTGVIGNPG